MNKKIGILVLVLFVIGTGCVVARKINSCTQEMVSIPIGENDSKLQVGEKIIEKYLELHKQKKRCFCGWIKNYQVNEIKTNGLHQDGENSFVASASFSVKPFLGLDRIYWIKQNGENENNNWIKNNSMFLIISKENKLYKLQGVIPDQN